MNKQCNQCGVDKPLSEFGIRRAMKSGYSGHCKECERVRCRNRRRSSPSSARARILRSKYGITGPVYDFLLKGQEYKCIICKKTPEENGKSLSVDHCHTTGDIRGLLCHNCNTGLGMFQDDAILLEIALEYLKEARPNARE